MSRRQNFLWLSFIFVLAVIVCLGAQLASGAFYLKTYPKGSFQPVPGQTHQTYILVQDSTASMGNGSVVTGKLVVIKPHNAKLVGSSQTFRSTTLNVTLTLAYPDGTGQSWLISDPCLGVEPDRLCQDSGRIIITDIVVCDAPDSACAEQ